MSSPISPDRLVVDLQRLGVAKGGVVMVHASLRKLGPVDGGAEAALAALLQAVGPEGTLLMVLSADPESPFDAATTPADSAEMGILAEVFRRHPRAEVNDHAADRSAAIGPLADELLGSTPLHDYHGPGSVLEQLVHAEGSVLRLGADPDTVTLTHYAEYLADLPHKRRVSLRYVRADIGEQWIDSLDDSDGIAVWAHGDYFPRILLEFVEAGNARVGSVGNCVAELFPAREFVDFAVRWMEANLTGDGRTDWSAE